MGNKSLTVATAVQKAVLENVLLAEITSGFWKNARPADHADMWKGVEIKVGAALGLAGWEIPRNYNFVNPDFFVKAGKRMLEAAQAVSPDITEKGLKKQLISLNQILGGRLKEIGGTVSKLPRGRKQTTTTSTKKEGSTKTTTVKRAPANIVENQEQEAQPNEAATS